MHELLQPGDPRTSCDPHMLHSNESPGQDVLCGDDKLWRQFLNENNKVYVDAAPIVHRGMIYLSGLACRGDLIIEHLLPVPCIGYVFSIKPPQLDPGTSTGLFEKKTVHTPEHNPILQTPRWLPTAAKFVVLGDTSDPSAITPLAMDASILVHEATNVAMPLSHKPLDNATETDSENSLYSQKEAAHVRELAISRGHSSAAMAGEFAHKIRAQALYLNHLSARCVVGS